MYILLGWTAVMRLRVRGRRCAGGNWFQRRSAWRHWLERRRFQSQRWVETWQPNVFGQWYVSDRTVVCFMMHDCSRKLWKQ